MKKIICTVTYFILLFILFIFFYKYNNKNYYFISYGNYNENTNVIKKKTNTKEIIKQYKNYDYIKIDKINNEEKVNYSELCNIIKRTNYNDFNYSISLSNNKINILKEELFIYKIIDYSSNNININNLNNYLIEKGYKYKFNIYDNITIINTSSLFYNKNKNKFEKEDNKLDTIISNGINRLIAMEEDNGKFIYGYNIMEGYEFTNYNILRHSGTIWSMIKYYQIKPNELLKNKIDTAIKYLISNIIVKNNNAYVVENKTNEIKLGGNALALITLSEYLNIFNNDEYFELAKKLATGIISMQNNDGSFKHVLNLDGSIKENFRTVYYDGEATLALLKFYQVSNDITYFSHSQIAIDYFILNNYNRYHDHWISYTMIEYLKYDSSDKYISFALNNYNLNKDRFNTNSFSPTKLELLTTIYKTYYELKEKNISNNTILDFNIIELKENINKELNILLSFYLTNSLSIYYKNPDKIVGGFYNLNNNYRMRIDDIQHSVLGIMNYQEIKKIY